MMITEKISKFDVRCIVVEHKKWLAGDGGSRADLSGRDLQGMSFYGKNLREANFCGADCCGVDFRRSNLSSAILDSSNCTYADFRACDLTGADFHKTTITEANFDGAIDGRMARLDFGGLSICVRSNKTSIGCRVEDNDNWLKWEPKDVDDSGNGAFRFWATHGDIIKAVIRSVMEKKQVRVPRPIEWWLRDGAPGRVREKSDPDSWDVLIVSSARKGQIFIGTHCKSYTPEEVAEKFVSMNGDEFYE